MNITITNSGASLFFNVDGVITSWSKTGLATTVKTLSDGVVYLIITDEPGQVMSFPYPSVTSPTSTSVYDLQNQVEAFLDSGASVSIGAGTAIIGKVGIDQTTPGTTNFVQNKQMPDATATFCPSQDVSGTLEASSISKSSAGVFYGMSGFNTLASAQWILIFNSATIPANGAVTPILWVRAAPSSNFSVNTGTYGIFCSAGISWCNSTDATLFNKTLGAADCVANVSFA